jgi:hypothetical protein
VRSSSYGGSGNGLDAKLDAACTTESNSIGQTKWRRGELNPWRALKIRVLGLLKRPKFAPLLDPIGRRRPEPPVDPLVQHEGCRSCACFCRRCGTGLTPIKSRPSCYRCERCWRAYSAAYKLENREKIRAYMRDYYQKTKGTHV